MLGTSVTDDSDAGSPTRPSDMARCDHAGLTTSAIDARLGLPKHTIAGGNDDT